MTLLPSGNCIWVMPDNRLFSCCGDKVCVASPPDLQRSIVVVISNSSTAAALYQREDIFRVDRGTSASHCCFNRRCNVVSCSPLPTRSNSSSNSSLLQASVRYFSNNSFTFFLDSLMFLAAFIVKTLKRVGGSSKNEEIYKHSFNAHIIRKLTKTT